MRSRAVAEKAWAWTVRFLVSSPWARILTGTSRFLASPAARRASGVTSAPASKRFSRSRRLTGWVWVRKGSKGIDIFFVGPRSLRIRMWIGFWPPSKRARDLAPERDPAPFCPRPEVLPVPEPSPRPTRLRGLREPGAGASECRPMRSSRSSAIDAHEVADGVHHPASLRGVLDLDRVADPAQAEGAQRVALLAVGPVGRADLRHLHARSEEHTSELQSRQYLVCRLLLEKKKKTRINVREEPRRNQYQLRK